MPYENILSKDFKFERIKPEIKTEKITIEPEIKTTPPKDEDEKTLTLIGDNVLIRESVTINRGTKAFGKTIIGNNVLLMAYVHIGHDCIVGNNTIMANLSTLGGHVEIGDWVNLGGGVMVHQFVKIGTQSMIGGGFRVVQDVPPYIIAAGEPLRFAGINKIGLKRRDFSKESRNQIKRAYKIYFISKLNRGEALKKIKSEFSKYDEIQKLGFILDDYLRVL